MAAPHLAARLGKLTDGELLRLRAQPGHRVLRSAVAVALDVVRALAAGPAGDYAGARDRAEDLAHDVDRLNDHQGALDRILAHVDGPGGGRDRDRAVDADPDWQRACGLDHALELAVVLADCLDRAPGNLDLHLAPGRAREIVVALADDLDVDPDLARQLGRDPDLALGRALRLDLSDEQGRCTPEAVHDALALLSGGPHLP